MNFETTRNPILYAAALGAAALLAACTESAVEPKPESKPFALTSPTLVAGGDIPQRHWLNAFGCTGENIRPALSWANAPAGTQGFAVTVFDKDAVTGGGFWHWITHDLPATATSLPEGPAGLPAGAVEANTDLGIPGWFGSCPVDGRVHRYEYTVYALKSAKLEIPAGASSRFATFILNQNVLAKATLEATAGGTNTAPVPALPAFALASPTLSHGGMVPQRHFFNDFGCSGENIRPALTWSGAPSGTKSYAITLFDNDAPTGAGFWHWVAYDIPATASSLGEGSAALPAGAVQGKNDLGQPSWFGSCPSDGKPHRYTYAVFALGVEKLDVPAGATAAFTSFLILNNALGKASLDGIARM